ncbi:MAG: YoaK family protein [Candidatus Acidiferrales bacterium]
MAEPASDIDRVLSLSPHSGMFGIASLFAIVGGFLDAYSYLARGRVFANAQTGNVVLFGVRAAAGNWTSAWQTLPPIFAYMCGVVVARLLRVSPQKRTFRATLICQALELIVLLVLLFFGKFVPDFCAVPLIAFSSALQNTSFSNIGSWEFNSTMTTVNLRNAVSGWVQLAMGETDPNLRGEAIVGTVISLCFAAGALLGGVCTLGLPAFALLPAVVLTAAGVLLTIRERQRRLSSQED